jgi:hypothetical protein
MPYIDENREYKISEVARPSKNNPAGLGLLPLKYVALRRRVLAGVIPARVDKQGSRTFYFIKGRDILRYINLR